MLLALSIVELHATGTERSGADRWLFKYME
jgi:hypothetical protein